MKPEIILINALADHTNIYMLMCIFTDKHENTNACIYINV